MVDSFTQDVSNPDAQLAYVAVKRGLVAPQDVPTELQPMVQRIAMSNYQGEQPPVEHKDSYEESLKGPAIGEQKTGTSDKIVSSDGIIKSTAKSIAAGAAGVGIGVADTIQGIAAGAGNTFHNLTGMGSAVDKSDYGGSYTNKARDWVNQNLQSSTSEKVGEFIGSSAPYAAVNPVAAGAIAGMSLVNSDDTLMGTLAKPIAGAAAGKIVESAIGLGGKLLSKGYNGVKGMFTDNAIQPTESEVYGKIISNIGADKLDQGEINSRIVTAAKGTAEQLKNERTLLTKRLYDEASEQILNSDTTNKILSNPYISARVQQVIKESGWSDPKNMLEDAVTFRSLPDNSIGQYDMVQKEIFGMAKAVKNANPLEYTRLTQIGDTIKNALLDQSEQYRNANTLYGELSEGIKTFQQSPFGQARKLTADGMTDVTAKLFNPNLIAKNPQAFKMMAETIANYDPQLLSDMLKANLKMEGMKGANGGTALGFFENNFGNPGKSAVIDAVSKLDGMQDFAVKLQWLKGIGQQIQQGNRNPDQILQSMISNLPQFVTKQIPQNEMKQVMNDSYAEFLTNPKYQSAFDTIFKDPSLSPTDKLAKTGKLIGKIAKDQYNSKPITSAIAGTVVEKVGNIGNQ